MTAPVYRNFTLLITQSPTGYQARVIGSPLGDDAAVDFQLPEAWERLGDALWQQSGSDSLAAEMGRRLYDTVFAGAVGASLVRNWEVADHRLRIVLRLDKGLAALATLPWEFLYASHLNRYLAPSTETPLVRYLEVDRGARMVPVAPPLVVLGVLSNPKGMSPLAVDAEWGRVQEAVSGLGAEHIRLERVEATWPAVQERLRRGPVHVLHFIGHGFFDAGSGTGALVFEDGAGQPVSVSAGDFKVLLHDQPALRLVFLNACEGARGGRSDSFAGVAQQLVQQGIPAVVAMQYPVSDQAALTLSREFYRALAAGYPVDAALSEARKAIFGLGDTLEWATPVLFSRSEDNRLIELVEPLAPCPYPGMRPFTTAQAGAFYGRDVEIADGVDRLRRHPFLTVIGPSGSGKSSLVFAGMIPALQKSTFFGPGEWVVKSMRPGATPLTELTKQLDLTSPVPEGRRLFLAVDQFEETFTLAVEEADPFQSELQRLMRVDGVYLVITVRADFYSELMASPLWDEVKNRRLEVTPLGKAQLREAIVRPAQAVDVSVEAALVERLVADAADQPGVLPLVQETLVLLWDRVTKRTLPLAAYEGLSPEGEPKRTGLQMAISRHADEVFINLPPEGQAIARRIFLRLIQFGEGRANTRRQQTVADLRANGDEPEILEQTLRALTDHRLLTVDGVAGSQERRVDISHEALISGWTLLQQWIREKQVAENTRRRLEDKVREWVRLQKSGGMLDLYELREARNWLAGDDAEALGISPLLLEFVSESSRVLAEVEAEKEAQHRRELEQAHRLAEEQQRRAQEQAAAGVRLRRRAQIAIAIGTLAVIAALTAAWLYREAEIQRTAATSARIIAEANAAEAERQYLMAFARQLAAQSELAQGDTALRLATKATMISDPATYRHLPEAEESLHRALATWSHWMGNLGSHDGPVQSLVYVPGEESIVSGGQDGRVILWSPDGNESKPLVQLAGAQEVYAIGIDPASGMMAIGTSSGQIHLYRTFDDPQEVATWQAHVAPNPVLSLTFTPDGDSLISGGGDGKVNVWSVDSPGSVVAVIPGEEYVRVVAISPDGRWLAAGGDNDAIGLWSMEGPGKLASEPALLESFGGHVNGAAFNREGTLLAVGSEDGTIHLIDLHQLDTPSAVLIHPSIASGVVDLHFDQSSQHLLIGTRGGGLVDLDLGGTTLYSIPLNWRQLAALDTSVDVVALASTARLAVTGEKSGVLRIWSLDQSPLAEPLALAGHAERIRGIVFFPVQLDAEQDVVQEDVISVSEDGEIIRWSSEGDIAQRIRVSEAGFLSADISPDGEWLATGGWDRVVRLWRSADLTVQPIELAGHQDAVVSVKFSPIDGMLATGSLDDRVLIWHLDRLDGLPERLGGHRAGVLSVAFDREAGLLGAGDVSGQVYLWTLSNLETGPRVVATHDGPVRSVTFSPDGRFLASVGDDGVVNLTPVAEGGEAQSVLAHNMPARWVTYSPDGAVMATGGEDMFVKLWMSSDLAQKPVTLTGHNAAIRTLAFSPDGSKLASGGNDRTILLWTAKLDGLQEAACHRIATEFSRSQWSTYFREEPYVPLCGKEESQ